MCLQSLWAIFKLPSVTDSSQKKPTVCMVKMICEAGFECKAWSERAKGWRNSLFGRMRQSPTI